MRSGRRCLFIYYRLAERALPDACGAVRRAQQALCERHPGLTAELLQRPQASADGWRTVMETYVMDAAREPEGIDAALGSAIEAEIQAVLRPWLAGPRHVEAFTDLK